MPRLTPCPSCHSHVMVGDRKCPHCGSALHTTAAPRASAVLLGLALAGCPGDDGSTSSSVGEPEYGVPDMTTTSATEGTTDGSATGSTTDIGEAEYGVPDTGIAESSGTESGSTSGPEPDYGVPDTGQATTSGDEPAYGVPETTSSG